MLKPTASLDYNYPPDHERAAGVRPGWVVTVTWSSEDVELDRPRGYAWGVGDGPAKRRLGLRLVRAIGCGAIFGEPQIMRDVNGKTYVSAEPKVRGRCLNADLSKLGY